MCADSALVNPDPTGAYLGMYRGSNPNPTNSQCVQEPETGGYYCGIAGAACSSVLNCDNGVCVDGKCQGSLGYDCAGARGQGDDSNCLGFLYCTSLTLQTASNRCGGEGAFCQDWSALDLAGQNATLVNEITGQFCVSGACFTHWPETWPQMGLHRFRLQERRARHKRRLTLVAYSAGFCRQDGNCGELATTLGASCAQEPFICGPGLTPSDPNGGTDCQCIAADATGPSQRARTRRRAHHRARSLCPSGQTACTVDGPAAFECVDVSVSLETRFMPLQRRSLDMEKRN